MMKKPLVLQAEEKTRDRKQVLAHTQVMEAIVQEGPTMQQEEVQ